MNEIKSFYHLYHEALLKRFTGSNDELLHIQTRIDQALAGIRGEERVQREFKDSMQDVAFIMLPNLQFTNENGFPHQIDLLVLTTQFIILAEVKNISGTLFYDSKLRQFHRVRFDGMKERFQNPFDQLQRHHEFLHYLLRKANYQIPIIPLIINANSNSTLDPSLRNEPILNVSSLRAKLSTLHNQYNAIVTTGSLLKLRDFLENQTVFHEGRRYVPSNSILKGVLCPNCNFKSIMYFENRTWRCPTCSKTNRFALKLALRDYRILMGSEITNRVFREWTGLQNISTASKLLGNFKLPHTGTYRNRVYSIPQEFMFLKDP